MIVLATVALSSRLCLLEFGRRTLQLRLGPVPGVPRQAAQRVAACSFVFHGLDAEILHAPGVRELQVEVATLDRPVHLKAEAQARILYQVYVDLLGDGLQLVGIQVGQRDLLHLNRVGEALGFCFISLSLYFFFLLTGRQRRAGLRGPR